MRKLINFLKKYYEFISYRFCKPIITVQYENTILELDTRWRHEWNYLNFIKKAKITGPLGIDVWVFSHFIKTGYIVLDAGANIGFTAILAEKSGANLIHCFEPDPRLNKRLENHCKGKNFIVYPMALGNQSGSLKLRLSSSHNQGSTLSDQIVGKFPEVFNLPQEVQVDVVTIDSQFGNYYFDFFKIDVEGFELETLQGSLSILKRNPPATIYIEVYDECFEGVHSLLSEIYAYAYRVICDRNGFCRLFLYDSCVEILERDGFYVMPPSYIYTNSKNKALTEKWTSPAN